MLSKKLRVVHVTDVASNVPVGDLSGQLLSHEARKNLDQLAHIAE